MRLRNTALALFILIICVANLLHAQTSLRKIGELELQVQGISATVQPANPTIPKNTAAGVRIVVTSPSGVLSSADVAKFLGGNFEVHGELSGPGLSGTITLPFVDPNGGGTPITDPLLLPIPALNEAGDYTLSNLRITVNGSPALDVSPSTIPVKVIDQVLITSVETRPLTLDEIKAAGVDLSSNDFLGFQFTIGLALQSNATTITFPVVFNRQGVPIPPLLTPPGPPVREGVPIPTIVPVLLSLIGPDGNALGANQITLPDGTPAPVKIPSVLVIPGNVGFLKQFFSAQVFVANGAPGGSGLVVHDISGTINLPPGDDGVVGTADDPLTLPTLKGVPQPTTKPILGVGPDGQPGTADDTTVFNPGDQGQAEFILEGQKEGFHQISFNIQGTLNGLATGPVTVTGLAQGGVLVRNPFFDMTFAVPGVVRNGEQFSVYITVKNISQALANDVKVTIDSAQLSGATLLSDPSQTINTIGPGGATTLKYQFKSLRTGQVTATYLHFDTNDGTTGELKFTLGVGERGIPLSPDTLVLPAAVANLPQSVVDAAMLVLGEGWSIANAPVGTLPAGVIQTSKAVVTKKALALAEAGLRVGLGQPVGDAVRDLLGDFYSGVPLDPGFDQLLRSTDAGRNLERAIGAVLAQPVSDAGGALNYQEKLSEIYASGQDFVSFAIASGSSAAPVNFTLTDGANNTDGNIGSLPDLSAAIPGLAQAPLGLTDSSPLLALLTAPNNSPYTLRLLGTGAGTMDVAVTMPHGDGSFIRGQISGVQVSQGSKARIVMDFSQPDRLVLEQDPNSDGTFPVQLPMSTTIISAQGPKFLSANVIGPETLPGATPLGVQMALLFDRVVDGTSAQQVANYQIPSNAVQQAMTQLSGRIVVANLQQPEGKIIPTTVNVSGIADLRGVVGSGGTLTLGSVIQDAGAVVSGRVFNGDGTPVTNAQITYSTVPPGDCPTEANEGPVGVSAIQVNSDGRYQFRYVHQDQCGAPFQVTTTDPNTGGQRQLSNFVRFDGQQIVMDIAIFGRGAVEGIVSDLTGTPVPGATVVAFSQTDTQIGGQTVTDGLGHYSVSGITVGPVVVQAGKLNSLGHAAGTIQRAGTTATINVTLDSGAVTVSGKLQVQQNGVTSPVPNWPVVYSLNDHPGLPPTPVGVVNTDANGNFTFTGVPEGNFVISAQLTATDRGSITGVATANQVLTGQNLTIVIDTVNVGTVNGKVFFPDKSAAAGVLVFSGTTGVLTDTNGNYSLPGLHVQSGSLTIGAETQDGLRSGSISVSLTQAGQVVNNANITLSGLGTAQFTVLDGSGKPVSGQNVALLGCPNACGCGAQATNAQGVVTFTGLPVGQVSVVAVSGSFDVANGTASIVSDGTTGFAVMRFAGTGTVTGNVLNPDSTPSFGANIALTSNVFNPDSCSLVPGISQQIATDQNGNFKFTNVKVGKVGVTASQPFFPTQVGAQGAIPGAGQSVNFNLKLVNTISGVLSGTVFLPDGVTPAGAGVQVTANGVLPDVTVSTDDNGHFAFAKIFPEGGYSLTASDPVTGGVIRDSIFLRAGQDMAHNLRLKGKGTVTVQVVDGSSVPVDNAFVTLTEGDYPNHVQQDAVQPSNQGKVTFDQVFEGPFSVVVSDIFGRGGRSSSVLSGPGATVNVVVQLTSTGTIQGHFLMPDKSTPIPFGIVRLIASGRQLGQVTTDGNTDPGSFKFTFVPAGPVTLEGQDPVTARTGIAAGSIDTDGQVLTLDVVAQGLGTVTGVVTSNNSPQPGAQVDVFSGSYHASTVSDATGTYLISGVPEGHIVVNASLQNGFLAGSTSGTLSGDGTQVILNVSLRGSGGLNGQVVQADGITPASASLVTVQVGGQGGGTLTVTTDTNGNFGFPVVPAGTANITVNVLGSIDEAQASVEVLSGSTVQTTIRLNGIGSITGHTLDSAGNPVQGHVTVTGTGAFPYNFTLDSSTDGSFFLPTVLAGTFTAKVTEQSGGFILFGSTSSGVVPNQTDNINIQVQPSGTVTGTILRSDGVTPAPGANVTLSLTGGGSVLVQAQTDGTFTAQGVPLGNFTLRVNDPVSTGQALLTGLNVSTNGQLVPLGNIVLNDTAMAVVSINPTDGSTGVPVNQNITIAFTDPLQSLSGISLTANGNGLFLTGSISTDGKMATFAAPLPDSAQIVVTVSTSVSDIFGRHPSQTTTATFQTVDLTPPHVVSIVPVNGALQVSGGATITVNFSEALATNSDLTNLIVVTGPAGQITGGTVLASPTQAVFTPSAPLLANSRFTVTVNGETDLSGNVQTNPFVSSFVTVDTIPPVLQLVSPPNGGFTASARPIISVNATDNLSGVNFSTAVLSLDGQQVATGTLSFAPPSNLADGLHQVTASVADNVGNVGTLSQASFGVDTQPPSAAQISGITEGQVLKGTVALTLSATDAVSGVAFIDLLADGNLFARVSPPFQFNLNTFGLSEGKHTLSAQATDNVGNKGVVGSVTDVIVDNFQLTVTITSPSAGSDFRDNVTVTATASEAVQSIQFTLGSQTSTVTTAPYTTTFSLAGFATGPQTITATATGFGDAPATASVVINVKRTPPPAPDSAKIIAPVSGNLAQVTGSQGAAQGATTLQITNLVNSATVTVTIHSDGSFVTSIPATVGDVLSLVSTDDVGNSSSATTVTATSSTASAAQPPRPDGSVIDTSNPLAANLVGLFLMNEGIGNTDVNLVDFQTASFAGTAVPTWNALDPSVAFNGGGAQVSFMNAGADLIFDQLPVSQMTVVAKIFVNSEGNGGGIAEKNDGNINSGFAFNFDNSGALRFTIVRSGQDTHVQTAAAAVPVGQWIQVAATWDGTVGNAAAAHLYVNGLEQGKPSFTDGTGFIGYANATNQPFRIGTSSIDFGTSLNGKMAYLAVYRGRMLSATELRTMDTQLPIKHLSGVNQLILSGTPVNVSTSVAGQSANLNFAGQAGQPASISFSNNSMGSVAVTVFNPDGTTLTSTTSSATSFSLPPQTLPANGNYVINITPGNPGTITVSLNLGLLPVRVLGSVLDQTNPLAADLAGLFVMNEGSGNADLNLVDLAPAIFSGTALPTWNTTDPSVAFSGGGAQVSYLNAGNDLVFDKLTPGQMTVVAKIFVNNLGNGGGIAEKNDGNINSGFAFNFDNAGFLRFTVVRTGQDTHVASANVVPLGQWVQVAATWDGTIGNASAAHLYVNGVEQGKSSSVDGTGTINFSNATNQPFRIGTTSIDFGTSLNGRMAYLAVYKGRILSPAEMKALDNRLPLQQFAGVTGVISPGTPETVSAANAGQTLSLDFSGEAGQPATVTFSNNTMGSVAVTLLNPDGSTLAATTSSATSFSLPTQVLPANGNYRVNILSGTAGSITVNVLLGPAPLRRPASVVDTSNPLSQSLAGLFLMNEGSGNVDLNLVDLAPAIFSGTALPTWNTTDPSVVFGGGGAQVSYLNAGNDLVFDKLTPGQMTVVAKIFVNNLGNGGGIAEKNDGNINSGFAFNFDNGGFLRFTVVRTGQDTHVAAANVVPVGQWIQVAATWDGTVGNASAAHLYINGVDQGKSSSTDGTGTINFSNATNQPFRIGTSSIDFGTSLNGRMAYLAVYKGRILSTEEMNALDDQLPIRQLSGINALIGPGTPETVNANAAAQNIKLAFSASASQPATVQFSNNTMGSVTVAVLNPDQSTLVSTTSSASSFNLPTQILPQNGTYAISLTSGAAGNITANVLLGPLPSRPAGATLDTNNPLATKLAGLFVMNEATGTTDLNLVNSHTANLSGTGVPTWNVFDPSLLFNGGGAQVSFLDAGTDLAFDQLTPGQMTIVSKVFVSNLGNGGGLAEKNDGNSIDSGFTFYFDNAGSVHLVVEKSSSDMQIGSSTAIITGQWVQVAATWDGTVGNAGAAHLFINGVEQPKNQSVDGSGNIGFANATNRPFRIGTSSIFFGTSLNGRMAYFAVYKGRILSSVEMNALDQQLPILSSSVPLSVSFASPAPGSSFNSQVTVTASTSRAAQHVDFTLGQTTISAIQPPFQATFDLTSVAEGNQTVTATAFDFEGHSATANLTIVVDHTAPPTLDSTKITVSTPVGGSVLVRGTAGAAAPLVRIEVTDQTSSEQAVTNAGSDGSFFLNLPAAVGDLLSMVAIDSAGNRSQTLNLTVPDDIPPASYSFTRAVIIDHTKVANTDQANFPVLVSGTYSYLATVANGGKVQNANGYDIIFSNDVGGTDKLDHEIESYDPVTGRINFWVRIPLLSHTADTVIYMQYGNAAISSTQENKAGVWDSSYQMILHLGESAAPYFDSTLDGYISNGGILPSQVAGQIGSGQSFNGSQYITFLQNQSPSPTSGITMEAWVKSTGTAAQGIFGKWNNDGTAAGDRSYELTLQASGTPAATFHSVNGIDTTINGTRPVNDGAWHHVVATTPSSGNMVLYVDGVANASANLASAFATTTDRLVVGAINLASAPPFLNGSADEIRISGSVRSADWIATEYSNQNAPATFYSISAENSIGISVSPVTGSLNAGQSQPFTATVTDTLNSAVTWSVTPVGIGVINSAGVYTAPATVSATQNVTITATSTAAPTKTASAVLTLYPASANVYFHHRAITIDHTKIPHTDQGNFPVLISGTYSYLATVANGGRVQNSSGFDIIFTSDAAGTNKLDHEIEKYDPVSGTITFWVRIPALSHTTDTVIYIQYGNAGITSSQENKTGVWNTNFQGVWHLNGNPLSGADSTANAFNGTVSGPTATTGQIDGAGNFVSASSQSISIGNMGPRPVQGTISMWVNAPSLTSFPNSFTTGDLAGAACGNDVIRFELNSAGVLGAVTGADNATCSANFSGPAFTSSFTAGIWHLLSLTWDSSLNTETAYYDGVANQTISNTFWPTNFDAVKIGVGWDTTRYWNGQIDEVRMSSTVRSADWISAEFSNQKSPSTFYAVGQEQ